MDNHVTISGCPPFFFRCTPIEDKSEMRLSVNFFGCRTPGQPLISNTGNNTHNLTLLEINSLIVFFFDYVIRDLYNNCDKNLDNI